MKNKTKELFQIGSNPNLTFIDIVKKRAEITPDQKVFTFLNSEGNDILTFSELDDRISKLASYLAEQNLRGERALLLYPPGIDYIIGFFACLYAGVIAVPVYPPDPSRIGKTLPRLQSIAQDASAKVALSTDVIMNQLDEWKVEIGNNPNSSFDIESSIFNLKWIATNKTENFSNKLSHLKYSSNDIAYLQYTSGSTGIPKGVIITHSNIVHNAWMIFNSFNLTDNFEGVIWLPIYHDMGLVGGILEPIFGGFHSTLMSPIDFLKRPFRWLQTISDIAKEKLVVSGGPNFAFDLAIRSTNPTKTSEIDLTNWVVAFNGAEPVRSETIDKFAETFGSAGFKKEAFFPCYGLAEATLIVSGGDREHIPVVVNVDKNKIKSNIVQEVTKDFKENIKLVGSGVSILENKILIVDPESRMVCADNEIGEIWTASESIANGYWGREDLSQEIFKAYTKDSKEGPFLRTGDLGFKISGELYITGRLKDLIIIRGSNHYPQDIEQTVEISNKLLRPSSNAAFSVDINGEEQLVVVQEARAKQNVNWSEVVEEIKTAIFKSHDILPAAIILIKPKTIFKTSSGKIRRNDCKIAFEKK